jgi:hypothetical protein
VQKAIEASLEEAGPAARRVGKPAAAPAAARFCFLTFYIFWSLT